MGSVRGVELLGGIGVILKIWVGCNSRDGNGGLLVGEEDMCSG